MPENGSANTMESYLRGGYTKVLDSIAGHAPLHISLNILAEVTENTDVDKNMLCSILLLNDENILRHCAGPRLPQFYIDAIDGIEIGETVGSCGAAAFLGEPVIVEDIQTHPNWILFKDLAAEANLGACWSEPIKDVAGNVMGTFAMYFEKPKKPSDLQMNIIKTSAYYARLAIESNSIVTELNKALAIANETNRSKSEFLASMSHDLRTPLNAIIGFSEVMEQEIFGAMSNNKYAEYAIDIKTSGQYLLHLVNDILDLATLDAGKRQLKFDWLDLRKISLDCQMVLHQMAEAKGLEYHTTVPAELPSVYADTKAIMQILMNLASNAIKFTRIGGVTVSARFDGEQHVIEVIDTGIGISRDDIKNITNRFSQTGNNPHLSSQEGSGLGLAITKSLVELHGGNIEIMSELDQGTKVSITLPYTSNPQ